MNNEQHRLYCVVFILERSVSMPKTKIQDAVYTVIMAAVMVYVMICYNISLNIGGLKNFVFLEAFKGFH